MPKFKSLKNNGKVSKRFSCFRKREIKAKSKSYLIPVEFRRKTRSISSKTPMKKALTMVKKSFKDTNVQ